MCNLSTPYHAACAHYAASKVSLRCIKALANAGHSRGCDEVVDLGVENAAGLCARCKKEGGLSLGLSLSDVDEWRDSGYASSFSSACTTSSSLERRGLLKGGDGPVNSLPSAPARYRTASKASSASSTSSISSSISRTEAATYARSLLASLPSAIPTVRRNASGVGLPRTPSDDNAPAMPPMSTISANSESGTGLFKMEQSNGNQHWRAFDGRAFEHRGVFGVV